MLKTVQSLLRKWLPVPEKAERVEDHSKVETAATGTIQADGALWTDSKKSNTELVPYDENLLENSRLQWQFGDWTSLAQLDRGTLQHHPDRAKLALLAAAGHQALGDVIQAGHYTRLATEWGCGKKLVSQILIAGVHNTLGRAAAAGNEPTRALKHFTASIETGAPSSPAKLLTAARARHQLEQLGLAQASPSIPGPSKDISPNFNSPSEERAAQWARECMQSDDIHLAVDTLVASKAPAPDELVLYFIELSDRFAELKDGLTALHFLEMAKQNLPESDDRLRALVVKRFIGLGKAEEAADITVRAALQAAGSLDLDKAEKSKLLVAYEKNRAAASAPAEHGHELLIAYLKGHLAALKRRVARPLVMVEIGSTREAVPGQGSTAKLAEFCRIHQMHFISVDMDPHNTGMAADLFNRMGVAFEAINMKGEDYLREIDRDIDFVFLDAYDFDHGQHSALRQSRYEKFLGQRIDDSACHQMHLDCATSVVKNLPPYGLVCLDDTWLEEGHWTAKGTLAMPYLLGHGFHLLEARNRAALLARSAETDLV